MVVLGAVDGWGDPMTHCLFIYSSQELEVCGVTVCSTAVSHPAAPLAVGTVLLRQESAPLRRACFS